jgi:hypothetical protein
MVRAVLGLLTTHPLHKVETEVPVVRPELMAPSFMLAPSLKHLECLVVVVAEDMVMPPQQQAGKRAFADAFVF